MFPVSTMESHLGPRGIKEKEPHTGMEKSAVSQGSLYNLGCNTPLL